MFLSRRHISHEKGRRTFIDGLINSLIWGAPWINGDGGRPKAEQRSLIVGSNPSPPKKKLYNIDGPLVGDNINRVHNIFLVTRQSHRENGEHRRNPEAIGQQPGLNFTNKLFNGKSTLKLERLINQLNYVTMVKWSSFNLQLPKISCCWSTISSTRRSGSTRTMLSPTRSSPTRPSFNPSKWSAENDDARI